MSIYANIKFEMKNDHKAPTLYDSQCGKFRDVALNIVNEYDKKHGNKKLSQKITLSGDELAEFAKLYADEVQFEKICFQIRDLDFGGLDEKNIPICDYFKNGEFTIEDNEIFSYDCYESHAFMPVYNMYQLWACPEREDDEKQFDECIEIFKRYIQLTLEGKMFFGIQISKIDSVTIELC